MSHGKKNQYERDQTTENNSCRSRHHGILVLETSKKTLGYKYVLKPSLFGDESMQTIQNRITEGLDAGATIVCVFDEDVRQWNDSERKRMDEIHQKYDTNKNVIIASSMPSIEYWLLLHFENTNRYFGSSAKVIETLKKHLVGFDKKRAFSQTREMAFGHHQRQQDATGLSKSKAFWT